VAARGAAAAEEKARLCIFRRSGAAPRADGGDRKPRIGVAGTATELKTAPDSSGARAAVPEAEAADAQGCSAEVSSGGASTEGGEADVKVPAPSGAGASPEEGPTAPQAEEGLGDVGGPGAGEPSRRVGEARAPASDDLASSAEGSCDRVTPESGADEALATGDVADGEPFGEGVVQQGEGDPDGSETGHSATCGASLSEPPVEAERADPPAPADRLKTKPPNADGGASSEQQPDSLDVGS